MFDLGIDKKTMALILGVFLVFRILDSGFIDTLFIIPGVLIAITFHEFAHAYVAYKLGDDTPKHQGRINLNPISHIDPLGFIFLILAGFGWGRPVEINPRNFNGKYSISKAEAIVAAAGPIMNFILAFILLIIFQVVQLTGLLEGLRDNLAWIINCVLFYAITINIGLGIFNLIPLPPLDGSKILTHFLPYNAKQWFYNNQQYFYIVFILIWITGVSGTILQPVFSTVYNVMNFAVSNLIGLFIR